MSSEEPAVASYTYFKGVSASHARHVALASAVTGWQCQPIHIASECMWTQQANQSQDLWLMIWQS